MPTEARPAIASAYRRRSRRHPVRNLTRVDCRKGTPGLGPDLTVLARDPSETGVRPVRREPLAVGQEVEVLLSGCGLARPLKLLGRVVWSVALAGAHDCASVAFDKPLRYADVERLRKLAM